MGAGGLGGATSLHAFKDKTPAKIHGLSTVLHQLRLVYTARGHFLNSREVYASACRYKDTRSVYA